MIDVALRGIAELCNEAADAIDSLRSQPAGGRDAERYRFLRDPVNTYHEVWNTIIDDGCQGDKFDNAIDAAMKESAK